MKKIFLILISASLLCACNDFLTETPLTSVYEEKAYDTPRTLESNMVGIYSSLSSLFACNSFCWNLNGASHYMSWTGNRLGTEYVSLHDGTMYPRGSANATLYKAGYNIVGKCNTLLDVLGKSPVDSAYKVEIAAEARFLRAFTYFALVRFWGSLVIVEHAPEALEDSFLPRSSFSDVYKFILKDLDYAEKYMRSAARQDAVNHNVGRSHKTAATALKAMVWSQIACLIEYPDNHYYDSSKPGHVPDFTDLGVKNYKDAWKLSLKYAEAVIASADYALEPDYRHLFRWDPVSHPEDYNSKERILVLNHSTTSQSCYYPQVTLWENPVGTNAKTVQMSVAGRSRPSVWVWENWCAKYGGVPVTIGSYPDNYEGCPDPRLDATFAYGTISCYDRATGIASDYAIYPSEGSIATATGSATSGFPFAKKYFSKSFNLDSGDADLYLMRYADVLLTAAEACAELGEGPGEYWTKAIGYVNQVLKRARESVDDISSPSSEPADWDIADYPDKKSLVSAIMWERVFELSWEDHEWFDSHKRGADWLIENVHKPINDLLKRKPEQYLKWFEQYFKGKYLSEDPARMRKGLLLSFPEYELRYNTALNIDRDQNDFYLDEGQ